ncbi:uncharacterized protein LOC135076550 [Ostrinia nubilalis]|uniref:uncharacterized protein LOC135076550 n=1 Tax=Ostrinia nubilalis TaxID=29057 RepID=UPI0030822D07
MPNQDDSVSLIDKFPRAEYCCSSVNVKSGTKLIAILGILIGLSCGALLLMQGRKQLSGVEVMLMVFIALFTLVTLAFVIVSVVLLLAAVDENPSLMSYYTWLAIIYLGVQLVLAIIIPVLLVVSGKYHAGGALIWMGIVTVVALGWTHFISVVSSYRMSLL